jgi:hypothetical protein
MKRQKVVSSNISSIWYDKKSSILEIEFNHWWVYQYSDVPPDEYQEIMNAKSHGKYFIENIKDAYECIKVS